MTDTLAAQERQRHAELERLTLDLAHRVGMLEQQINDLTLQIEEHAQGTVHR